MKDQNEKQINDLNELTDNERELGTKPIKKLIPLYCLPLILGSLFVGLQLVVDLAILSTGVSQEAVAAIGILFPYFLIMAVLYDLFGPGGAAIAAKEISKGNFEYARSVAGNGIGLCFVITAIISILSFIFMDGVIYGLGGTDVLYESMVTFLKVFLVFMPFMTTGVVIFFFVRADGKPLLAGLCNVIPPIIAMFVEYFIVFYGGLGIEASAISAMVALLPNCLLFLWFIFGKTNMHMHIRDFKFVPKTSWQICKVGFPSCAIQLFYIPVMIIAANLLAANNASVAETAAYSVLDAYFYYFLTFIGFGFGLGAQPIVGYNFSTAFKRAKSAINVTLIFGIITLVAIIGLCYIFLNPLSNFFAAGDAAYAEILKEAIAMYIWGLPLLTIFAIIAFSLQAAEKIGRSTLLVFMRTFIITIPLLYLFTSFMGVRGIWIAFPIAELISAAIAYIVLRKYYSVMEKKAG